MLFSEQQSCYQYFNEFVIFYIKVMLINSNGFKNINLWAINIRLTVWFFSISDEKKIKIMYVNIN